MITIIHALQSLRPGAQWSVAGNDVTWLDATQTQPTAAEIAAEIARLEADYAAKHSHREAQRIENEAGMNRWQRDVTIAALPAGHPARIKAETLEATIRALNIRQ